VWWGSVVPYKNYMIRACTRVLMYLASSRTTFEHNRSFTVIFYESYGLDSLFCGRFTDYLRVLIGSFTDMEHSLFFCVFWALHRALPPSLLPAIPWLRACTLLYLLSWRLCTSTAHPFIPSTLAEAEMRDAKSCLERLQVKLPHAEIQLSPDR